MIRHVRVRSWADGPEGAARNGEASDRNLPDLYTRLSVPGVAVTHHRRSASVDALRATAALMVLVSHVPMFGPSDNAGVVKELPHLGVGVWIFFATSGYLIAGPFLRALVNGRPLPRTRRYALRRAVRILPAYWIALGVILLFANGPAVAHWWQVPVHALLLQGLVPGELGSLYLVAWSLGVEAIFYVLVPLGAWSIQRITRGRPIPLDTMIAGVLILWCAGIGSSLALALAFPIHGSRPLPGAIQILSLVGILANFCPGMLAFLALQAGEGPEESRWRRRYSTLAARPLPTLVAAALLFVSATEVRFQVNALGWTAVAPVIGVASGLVLIAFLHAEWIRPVARVLAPIGLASYGVYLWHFVILTVLVDHGAIIGFGGGKAVMLARTIVLVGLTLPIAMLSWLLVERPLLRRTTGWEQRGIPKVPAKRDELSEGHPVAETGPSPVPAASAP